MSLSAIIVAVLVCWWDGHARRLLELPAWRHVLWIAHYFRSLLSGGCKWVTNLLQSTSTVCDARLGIVNKICDPHYKLVKGKESIINIPFHWILTPGGPMAKPYGAWWRSGQGSPGRVGHQALLHPFAEEMVGRDCVAQSIFSQCFCWGPNHPQIRK